MAYSGMAAADFDDIQRLNRAFLELGRHRTGLFAGVTDALSGAQRAAWHDGTVATAIAAEPPPYLLFHVALDETDAATASLFPAADDAIELAMLALGFMQRLSRREAFSLRVAAGLTAAEQQRLIGTAVTELGKLARSAPRPLVPALAEAGFFWPGLIAAAAGGDQRRLRTLLALGHHHTLRRAGLAQPIMRRAARTAPTGRRVADVR